MNKIVRNNYTKNSLRNSICTAYISNIIELKIREIPKKLINYNK